MSNEANVSVTEKSIKALLQLKSDLELTNTQAKKELDRLEQIYNANKKGLGVHSQDIKDLLDSMREDAEEAAKPIKKLAMKLNTAATVRRTVVNKNNYGRRR